MGKRAFRILIGLIAVAHLLAISEAGALAGFFAIWALIFAVAPLMIAATFLFPNEKLSPPDWTPELLLGVLFLVFAAVVVRLLLRARMARLAGEHALARRAAAAAFLVASVPSCLMLSVLSLAREWPG